MKKAIPILAVALLGLGMCSGVLAVDVGGFVWFDTTENYPAPCAWVLLYSDTLCGTQINSTQAVAGGFYEFTGLLPGNYGLKAHWVLTSCAYCDSFVGDDCPYEFWSECEKFTVIDEDTRVDIHLDMDCECVTD